VTAETGFGQAPSAGTSASFSRADHSHGSAALPALPVPADTVTAETAFGQAPKSGTSVQYSRADHSHGTPAGAAGSQDVVTHPPKLPNYAIEAAGIARANSSNPTPEFAPNYNQLMIEVASQARLRVRFKTYQLPNGKFQYILKVAPVYELGTAIWKVGKIVQPVAYFEKYDDQGIIFVVLNLGAEVTNTDVLANLAFVVEVSRYEAG
jgi:hypothetical protein